MRAHSFLITTDASTGNFTCPAVDKAAAHSCFSTRHENHDVIPEAANTFGSPELRPVASQPGTPLTLNPRKANHEESIRKETSFHST